MICYRNKFERQKEIEVAKMGVVVGQMDTWCDPHLIILSLVIHSFMPQNDMILPSSLMHSIFVVVVCPLWHLLLF